MPKPHSVDGGRSSVIRDALHPVLETVRLHTSADAAIALHLDSQRMVVLDAAGEAAEGLLVNERVRCTDRAGHAISLSEARSARDVVLTSEARPFRLEFSSAMFAPWDPGEGQAVALVGRLSGQPLSVGARGASAYQRWFAAIHRDAAYRGTLMLSDDLAAACKAIDRSQLDTAELDDLLETVATMARNLLGTHASYIAMADRASEAFSFTTLVGIRTQEFGALRVAPDQGLGGLSRMRRATVHTMDYLHDWRIRAPLFEETSHEGLVSVICVPLLIDGVVAGNLYLGDRELRAFSDTDIWLINTFAEHATLGLQRRHREEHRLRALHKRHSERQAVLLHDSVVRSLVEIGYRAHEAGLATDDVSSRAALEQIGTVAESALKTLRQELSSFGQVESRGQHAFVGELVETLRLLPRRHDVERTFELRGISHEIALPRRLFDALTSVGEEAISNAEIHSGCTHERIVLERHDRQLRLTVADNGCGFDFHAAERAVARGSGHFGLRTMRSDMHALQGVVHVRGARAGTGTEVVAAVAWPSTALTI